MRNNSSSNIGQEYVKQVPWLVRAILGCAVLALILGSIIGWLTHARESWKIDLGIFVGLLIIEVVFRKIQNRT